MIMKSKRNRKNRKILKKMIKIGIAIAILFWLLCMLLDLFNHWNMQWDKAIRLIHEQGQTITSLEYELETVKAENAILDWRATFAQETIVELENELKAHNPSWSSQGVIAQPQIIEIAEETQSETAEDYKFTLADKSIMIPATVVVLGKAAFTLIRAIVPAIP